MNLKKNFFNGLIWSSVEKLLTQAIQFSIGILIARLLSPSDYGLIGMIVIIMAISDIIVEGGFSNALIQKNDRDDKDFSTVFYFNIVIGLTIYSIVFLISPLISNFYGEDSLVNLTRVLGLTILISSFSIVQRTILTINLDFKTQTKISFISIFVSGILAFYLAYNGYGVWSLVFQAILKSFLDSCLLIYNSKWKPSSGFYFKRFKSLFNYGSKMLLTGLLNTTFNNIYLILIGKFYSASNLGFYTRAKQINDFPSSNLTAILLRVSFPTLSKIQKDNIRLLDAYKKIITFSAIIIFPLMTGLIALSYPLITVLLTELWIDTAWILQILCLGGMLYPIHALNLNIIAVKGRSDLFLKLELIKKSLITIVLIITIPMGFKQIIIGQVVCSYLLLFINTYYTKLIFNYGFFKQLNDIYKPFILSIIMGLLTYFTVIHIESNLLKLIFGFLTGLIFYSIITWVLNIGNIRFISKKLFTLKYDKL